EKEPKARKGRTGTGQSQPLSSRKVEETVVRPIQLAPVEIKSSSGLKSQVTTTIYPGTDSESFKTLDYPLQVDHVNEARLQEMA
ncbi:hypothetical protein Q0M83_14675, partial [Staphylococcus aureus]|nr:hypothetical protein [Staphylococcus aureus]